jgi:hypothetical protein
MLMGSTVKDCIKTAFINANGLAADKISILNTTLKLNQKTIIFIAETWFINYDNINKNPYFYAASNISPKPETGHRRGGIYCLAHPSLQPSLNITSTSTSHLSISIMNQFSISCIYIEPSLPGTECYSVLSGINSDIVLGDFNIHYKHLGATTNRPAERIQIIDRWAESYGYSLANPNSMLATTDHVFVKNPDLIENYNTVMPCIPTDHKYELQFDLSETPELIKDDSLSTIDKIRRFSIKSLSEPGIADLLCKCYDSSGSMISRALAEIQSLIETQTQSDEKIQSLVDTAYLIISNNIQETATQVLGEVDINHAKESINFHKIIEETNSHTTAVKMFKRGMNSRKRNLKTSSGNFTSPIEEAIHFFEKVYRQPDSRFDHKSQQVIEILDRNRFERRHHPPAALSPTAPEFIPGREFHYSQRDDLTIIFTPETIRTHIQRYSNMKSCGKDGIHTKILKTLCDSQMAVHLYHLFAIIWTTGRTPSVWNESIVHLIPKGDKEYSIPNSRPIALTLMMRRIFEMILLTALEHEKHHSSIRDIHPSQAGFRRGNSTILHSVISNDRQNSTIRAFIDLKQAYDRVPVAKLLGILVDKQCPPTTLRLIDSLFCNCSSQIVVNNALTRRINRERGLFQGSILSPFLFTVFIDELTRALNSNCDRYQLRALFFADDIQILDDDPETIQQMLDRVTCWCIDSGMEVGINKCGIINSDRKYELSQQIIPTVKTYKYLGFHTTKNGIDWNTYVNTVANKATTFLRIAQRGSTNWPIWVRLIIFKAFIRPQWEFGSPLLLAAFKRNPEMASKLTNTLEACQNEAITWVARLPTHHRHGAARAVFGILTIRDRMEQLSVNAVNHFRNSSSDNPFRALSQHHQHRILIPQHWLHRMVLQNDHYDKMIAETGPNLSMRGWLRQFANERFASYGILAGNVYHGCRTVNGGPDTLTRQPKEDAKRYLAWRLNLCLHDRLCKCDLPFTRNHLTRCLGDMTPEDIIIRNQITPSGNVLDHFLNTKQYHRFDMIFNALNEQLQKRSVKNTSNIQ